MEKVIERDSCREPSINSSLKLPDHCDVLQVEIAVIKEAVQRRQCPLKQCR